MKKILPAIFLGIFTLAAIAVVHAANLPPNENIFDTLSVDLKVNGSDDPVNVAVGERITISWESDGTERCKGNWSKKDLRLNGKISGKLSRSLTGSVTVRIACIDEDNNRDDDSVVLKIGGSSIPPPPPAPDQPIIISSCGEVTKSGEYTLLNDLLSDRGTCLRIHDVTDVNLNCNNFSIIGKPFAPPTVEIPDLGYAVSMRRVNSFSMSRCRLDSLRHNSLLIEKSQGGTLSENIFSKRVTVIGSENITVSNNIFRDVYEQSHTLNSVVMGNFFLSPAPSNNNTFVEGLLVSYYGVGNRFEDNTLDGRAEGILEKKEGADDGILLDNETRVIVVGNNIKNIWDCGIETKGLIADSELSRNNITNAGFCGIGGWYFNSFRNNVVMNNHIEDAPYMFVFFRNEGLQKARTDKDGYVYPAEEKIYFNNNTFDGNTAIKLRQKGKLVPENTARFDMTPRTFAVIEGTTQPNPTDFITGNNVFKNNNFTTVKDAPVFSPTSMIIDGGWNICGKISDAIIPSSAGNRSILCDTIFV